MFDAMEISNSSHFHGVKSTNILIASLEIYNSNKPCFSLTGDGRCKNWLASQNMGMLIKKMISISFWHCSTVDVTGISVPFNRYCTSLLVSEAFVTILPIPFDHDFDSASSFESMKVGSTKCLRSETIISEAYHDLSTLIKYYWSVKSTRACS